MTTSDWQAVAAVAGVLLAIATLIFAVYTAARRQSAEARKTESARDEKERRERAEIAHKAYVDGAGSRNDEVRQLKFERDDARLQRDDLKTEVRDLKTEMRDLRKGGG